MKRRDILKWSASASALGVLAGKPSSTSAAVPVPKPTLPHYAAAKALFDCHDRPGTVTGQHVVGDENRHRFTVGRVGRVAAQEDAGLFLVLLALQV